MSRWKRGSKAWACWKTTASGFTGFLRDDYTTLKEADDRILATDVEAHWRYAGPVEDYTAAWNDVRTSLVETFARHQSASVQHTLYAMGEAALARRGEISEIGFVYRTGITCGWTWRRSGWTIRTRYLWLRGNRTAGSRRSSYGSRRHPEPLANARAQDGDDV